MLFRSIPQRWPRPCEPHRFVVCVRRAVLRTTGCCSSRSRRVEWLPTCPPLFSSGRLAESLSLRCRVVFRLVRNRQRNRRSIRAGFDIPYHFEVLEPENVNVPEIKTVWYMSLKLLFDWRYYL